jgi:hypothetical protein
MAPVSVANELGDRCERGRTLAGAKRSDQEGRVALVEIRRGALLV